MKNLDPQVDLYLADGCGRCKYYATADCKVKKWKPELQLLRQIVLESNLQETLKWSMPVYTFQNKNIVIISAFKSFCSINFFKGVLLKDDYQILEKQGESSQSSRIIKITAAVQLLKLGLQIKEYIEEAIEIEKNGTKVVYNTALEVAPEELLHKFLLLPDFKQSFYKLSLGKQRAYIIYFSQPKQSNSIMSRIDKCILKINNGEGLNDNYKSKIIKK